MGSFRVGGDVEEDMMYLGRELCPRAGVYFERRNTGVEDGEFEVFEVLLRFK